jgi:hypothetical protein
MTEIERRATRLVDHQRIASVRNVSVSIAMEHLRAFGEAILETLYREGALLGNQPETLDDVLAAMSTRNIE